MVTSECTCALQSTSCQSKHCFSSELVYSSSCSVIFRWPANAASLHPCAARVRDDPFGENSVAALAVLQLVKLPFECGHMLLGDDLLGSSSCSLWAHPSP